MTGLETVYDRVSKKHNVSKALIESIFKSQFELVKNTMKEKEGKAIKLQLFGTFRVKPGVREAVNRETLKHKQQ